MTVVHLKLMTALKYLKNRFSKEDYFLKGLNRRIIGFIGATLSLAAIYAASSAPIPLYTTYRQILGLSNADLSLSSVLYFIGTVISLLFFARISNYIGRRPMVLSTLVLSAMGCLIFGLVNSSELFLIGRFIQGLSCGMGSSCIGAYIVDTSKGKEGAIATSSAPMIGLALGSFGSGALVQYGTGSLTSIYFLVLLLLIFCALLIAFGQETVHYTTGAMKSIFPTIRVPENIRSLLPTASAVFVGTWAVGGFYQAFSAPMASEQLGTDNVMIAAAVFACLQAPNIIGSSFAGKMKTRTAQKIGMSLFLFSVIAVIVSLGEGLVIPFLFASAFAGLSWGMAYAGSLQGILSRTTAADRAGVLSTIYIISYSGAAVPNLVVGRVAGMFNLFQISMGYGILVLVAWFITIIVSKNVDKKEGVQWENKQQEELS